MACLFQPEPKEIQVVLQPEGRDRGPCWASAAGQGRLSGLLCLSLVWTFRWLIIGLSVSGLDLLKFIPHTVDGAFKKK